MLVLNSLTFGPTPHNLIGVNYSAEIAPGQIAAIYGPSGSGKTTLLRAIAGLAHIDRGSISVFGHDLTRAPLKARRMAYMEQSFPLFDELSVGENIALEDVRLTRGLTRDARSRATEALGLLALSPDMVDRAPASLSGGERQRVALARALASRQRLILLDEPLSNLDQANKLLAIKALQTRVRELDAIALVVCHDHFDALEMSDVLVMAPFTAGTQPFMLANNAELTTLAREHGFGVPGGVQSVPWTAVSAPADLKSASSALSFIATDIEIGAKDDDGATTRAHVLRNVATPLGALVMLRLAPNGETIAAFAPGKRLGVLDGEVDITIRPKRTRSADA